MITKDKKLNNIVVEKHRENEGLRNKNAGIPHLEDKIENSERNIDTLRQNLQDRDRLIAELRTETRPSKLKSDLLRSSRASLPSLAQKTRDSTAFSSPEKENSTNSELELLKPRTSLLESEISRPKDKESMSTLIVYSKKRWLEVKNQHYQPT